MHASQPVPNRLDELLRAIQRGDGPARDEFMREAYAVLHTYAGAVRRRMLSPQDTLQTTALLHEGFLKAVEEDLFQRSRDARDFFVKWSRTVQDVAIGVQRGKYRLKRGGDRRKETIEELTLPSHMQCVDQIALEEALTKLGRRGATGAVEERVFRLRYFLGWTHQEIAALLDNSKRTIELHWQRAKAFVAEQLKLSAADSRRVERLG